MGLDWVVLDKQEGGRTVDAWETLGARRLDKADPETVEAFRQRYEQNRATLAARPAPKRTWLDRLLGSRTSEDKDREYWERPFEEVLEDAAADDPPTVVIYPTGDDRAGLAAVSGPAVRDCDFRAKQLKARHNSVISATGFDDSRLSDLSIEEMRALADDLEAALGRYREMPLERNEAHEQIVADAVDWLRFWAAKGHAVAADY